MKRFELSVLVASLLFPGVVAAQSAALAPVQHEGEVLEQVFSSPVRPGNVAVANDGRVFISFHPLGTSGMQLAEIKDGQAIAYPSAMLQKQGSDAADANFDTLLGVQVDKRQRLWAIDMGLNLGRTRLWAFDLADGTTAHKITLPADIAPKGSFVQDFVIDETRGWAYLADIANPGLIALELSTGKARRFSGHPSLQSENVDLVIDGQVIDFNGKPARVGVNPITISDDRDTLYFGAMNGTQWYQLPARLLREGASDEDIGAAIRAVGPKPVSDGVATDAQGHHYFTDLGGHAVTRLSADGQRSVVVRDPRLSWPDNVAVGADGWLYISVNQLHTTPAFTGGVDAGKPPYAVYRFRKP